MLVASKNCSVHLPPLMIWLPKSSSPEVIKYVNIIACADPYLRVLPQPVALMEECHHQCPLVAERYLQENYSLRGRYLKWL